MVLCVVYCIQLLRRAPPEPHFISCFYECSRPLPVARVEPQLISIKSLISRLRKGSNAPGEGGVHSDTLYLAPRCCAGGKKHAISCCDPEAKVINHPGLSVVQAIIIIFMDQENDHPCRMMTSSKLKPQDSDHDAPRVV
jgi:hypothetical protein